MSTNRILFPVLLQSLHQKWNRTKYIDNQHEDDYFLSLPSDLRSIRHRAHMPLSEKGTISQSHHNRTPSKDAPSGCLIEREGEDTIGITPNLGVGEEKFDIREIGGVLAFLTAQIIMNAVVRAMTMNRLILKYKYPITFAIPAALAWVVYRYFSLGGASSFRSSSWQSSYGDSARAFSCFLAAYHVQCLQTSGRSAWPLSINGYCC